MYAWSGERCVVSGMVALLQSIRSQHKPRPWTARCPWVRRRSQQRPESGQHRVQAGDAWLLDWDGPSLTRAVTDYLHCSTSAVRLDQYSQTGGFVAWASRYPLRFRLVRDQRVGAMQPEIKPCLRRQPWPD